MEVDVSDQGRSVGGAGRVDGEDAAVLLLQSLGGRRQVPPTQGLLSNDSASSSSVFLDSSSRVEADTSLASYVEGERGGSAEESLAALVSMNATTVTLSLLLLLLILVTVIGNVFVITAILRERNLRTFGNYLVFSLAIADLMVACIVMPISAINEVTGYWPFGPILCDFFTCMDVLSCTASILHLVAIALDRYWAVTNVHYITSRTSRSIGFLIGSVWAVAAVVSTAPVLGWKDDDFLTRITQDKRCAISQDMMYQILATCTTFYAPLVVILILYWKIYQVSVPPHLISLSLFPSLCQEARSRSYDGRRERGSREGEMTTKGTGRREGAAAIQRSGWKGDTCRAPQAREGMMHDSCAA